MNKKNQLLCMIFSNILIFSAQAQNKNPNTYAFMTAHDATHNTVSNVNITNETGHPISVSQLYIIGLDVQNCSSCYASVFGGDNVAGTKVSPTTFATNQKIAIGQNYLYNMLYNYLSFAGSFSPCKLPGCSWPGDNANAVSPGWCISINAASLDSSYTYSRYTNGSNPPAKAPAYGAPGNSPENQYNYKYALIDPSTLGNGNACIGPISCDDKTLTCSVGTPQNESFQPY